MYKKIVGKSIPNQIHLENRVKQGISNIEIQLFGNKIDPYDILHTIDKVSGLKVNSVHAPLGVEYSDVNIENLASEQHKDLIYYTSFIANELGKKYNEIIPVVIHTNIKIEDVFLYQESWSVILKRLYDLLQYNHYICFAIENIIPFINDVYPTTCNNFMFDNVKLVKYLREELCTDKFYTTFDVCHAVSTINFLNTMRAEGASIEIPTLEYYFQKNSEYCRIFHFSDVKGLGLNKKDHGIAFAKSRESFLLESLSLYDRYLKQADLVIEMQEENYETFENLTKTFNYLENYYNSK